MTTVWLRDDRLLNNGLKDGKLIAPEIAGMRWKQGVQLHLDMSSSIRKQVPLV